MRLKFYNLIIIVPIFLILAVILTSFSFYIQKKEIINGLDEEINSVTKSISIFLTHKDIKNELESIENSFKKIIKYDRVKRIILVDKTDVLIEKEAKDIKDNKFAYNKAKLLEITAEDDVYIYSDIQRIKNSTFKLFVSIDATAEKKAIDYVLYQSVVVILIMIVLGVISSILLSYITSKNIKSLNAISDSISQGDYTNSNKSFLIKEFSDLSNTLDIVKSILKEILYKTKNSILDTDLFSKGDDIIKPKIVVDEVKSIIKDNYEVSISANTKSIQKDFFNCWQSGKYIYAFIGELNTTSDYLKDYIGISSISKLVKYYIETNSFDMKKISQMYDIRTMVTIKIDMESNSIEQSKLIEGHISNETMQINDGELKTFYHHLNVDAKLKNYIEMYSYMCVDDLILDINKIFDKESAIIFVKKEQVI